VTAVNRSGTLRQLAAGLRMLAVLTVVLGLLYPAAVWGVGRLAFPHRAAGSLVEVDGRVVGSSLLGQDFRDARHFWSRPSASDYSGRTSGGSNLSPVSAAQRAAVHERERRYAAANGGAAAPPDALTACGSGLDPHISPANAAAQAPRVAAATGVPLAEVRRLVAAHTRGRVLGFLGEPRVEVLALNLAVDRAAAGR
jgi:K+-transporting ATPase ATPase C chain